jgi:hypothetical protein
MISFGCVSARHVPFEGPPRGLAAAPVAEDPPPPERPEIEARQARSTWLHHDVLELRRPAPCTGEKEPGPGALAMVSREPGLKRWVVVLPIWGSSEYPPRKIVRWLLEGPRGKDTNVLWVQGYKNLQDYPAMMRAPTEEAFLAEVGRTADCIGAAARDVSSFADWIFARPETDPHRVGIVGFSISAMVACSVMGRDPRFSAGVLVMVGGHFHEILATCSGEEREVREHTMARFGWSLGEFRRAIEAPLAPVDPVLYAGKVDPSRVLYIDAGKDTCIPASAREDLWEALGRPERFTVNYSHKRSFLSMTILGFDVTTRRIVRFLDQKLGTP